jgi:hypothetical protein
MAYDSTKPTQGGAPVSADVRANFEALRDTLSGINLIRNAPLIIWPTSLSSAPAHFGVQGGAGSAIALNTSRTYGGAWSAMVTGASAASEYMYQNTLTTSSFMTFLRGQYVSMGCALNTTSANCGRIGIYDGTDTTWSDYVTAASSWNFTWTTVTHQLNSTGANQISARFQTAQGLVTNFSLPTMLWGQAPPRHYHQPRRGYQILGPGTQLNNLSSGTYVNGWRYGAIMPMLVLNTRINMGTAPTGQPAIWDVNKNGSTMYSTRPQVGAGATAGNANPDLSLLTASLATGDVISADQDQVGSGATGADATLSITALCYPHPFADVHSGTNTFPALAETGA